MEKATRDFAPSERLLEIAEEFVDRVRNRESPTVDEYAERFPEEADEIRRYLPMLVPASSTQSVGDAFGNDFPIPPQQLPAGINRYQVQTLIGSGSMGTVYLARDLELDRIVAFKMPQLDHPQSLERFYREARAMATVDHRNICSVYDVGQIAADDIDSPELRGLVGRPFLTMAFIEGEELTKRINKPWDQIEAAQLVSKIASALQVVHDAGVVHRDVKPGNIIIDSVGEPVITDFGLARRDLPEEVELTVDGQIIGSPAYMSPEQINGRPELGPQADIYSLGVLFYEMICGRRPFTGSPLTLLRDICWKEAPEPRQLRSDLNSDIEAICLRAIEKEPEKRYPKASDLAADLDAYLAGHAVSAQRKQTSPVLWLLFGAALVGTVLGVGFLQSYLAADRPGNVETISPKTDGAVTVEHVSLDEFREELNGILPLHFRRRTHSGRKPDISAEYAKAFAACGINSDSTSANALKVFLDTKSDEFRADVLVGLESWLLCAKRQTEDVPVPWLRTQLEANHAHHSPLRTALLELNEERVKLLTKEFAVNHSDPRLPVVWSLYMRDVDSESATWLLKEASKVYSDPNVFTALGLLQSRSEKNQASIANFDRALELQSSSIAYVEKSSCHLRRKEFEQAIAAARQAVELDPEYGFAHLTLGKTLYRCQQRDEAHDVLALAISLDCNALPQAHRLHAHTTLSKSGSAEAMVEARKAIKLFRENEAWYNLTRFTQDLLDDFEQRDEHAFVDQRYELTREFFKAANGPNAYRRLRPYVNRLINDIDAGDSSNKAERLARLKKMLTNIDRLKKQKKK